MSIFTKRPLNAETQKMMADSLRDYEEAERQALIKSNGKATSFLFGKTTIHVEARPMLKLVHDADAARR